MHINHNLFYLVFSSLKLMSRYRSSIISYTFRCIQICHIHRIHKKLFFTEAKRAADVGPY